MLNLSTNRLPFDLNLLPPTAYLVGGAVRDTLLNIEREYLDLDFVIPELAIEIARKIAKQYKAGFVVLDENRKIARVVFKQGTVDFAQQEGNSLEEDLRRRDFTINAIAYNFYEQKIIDPLKGLDDLATKTIRMIRFENLQDDPLRLLRAYRQSSQLDFTIEPETRQTIRHLSPLITQVAAERVQTEFNYLLTHERGTKGLMDMEKDGLINYFFPHVNQKKLALLQKIDEQLIYFKNNLEKNNLYDLLYDRHYNSLVIKRAKLLCLVSNLPEEAKQELITLKYARDDIKSVSKVLSNLLFIHKNKPEITLRKLYFFFLDIGENFPILALFALAKSINNELIFTLLNYYLDPKNLVAHPSPLVTGHDLIKHLNIKPSPQLGQLLTEITIAHIEGKICSKEQAFEFAITHLNNQKFSE
ncbi:MAG: CCA tRNA nucleotidyltransferase [Crocosphaera sp.]|nr:CCA tRNA nucleotidyltransferase [Crocosphaera sp.]